MKNVTKIWFTVGPYEGLLGYTTKKDAVANKVVGETLVGLELNQNQARTITKAINEAFASLG